MTPVPMTTVQPPEESNPTARQPDVGDIPQRPDSPAVIRFLGCDAEMAGLNTDYFTIGRTDDSDLKLPDALGGSPSLLLRFSRGPEGWRLSPSEHQPVFVNQELVDGLTSLRSGDVIRFAPAGPGMQFSIVHQNATPLSNLIARYAPRLLGDNADNERTAPRGDDSVVNGMSPLRYEAGGAPAPPRSQATAAPAPEPRGFRLDPAVLVASSILLAGVIAGAAFLYSASESADETTLADEPAPPPSEPIGEEPTEEPVLPDPVPPTEPSPIEPPIDKQPADDAGPAKIDTPSAPPETDPSLPDDNPFSDL